MQFMCFPTSIKSWNQYNYNNLVSSLRVGRGYWLSGVGWGRARREVKRFRVHNFVVISLLWLLLMLTVISLTNERLLSIRENGKKVLFSNNHNYSEQIRLTMSNRDNYYVTIITSIVHDNKVGYGKWYTCLPFLRYIFYLEQIMNTIHKQ